MGWAKQNLSAGQRQEIAASLFEANRSLHNNWLNGKCPFHEDDNPSFGYHILDDVFHCQAGCDQKGDLIDLYCLVNGLDAKEGFKRFKSHYGTSETYKMPTALKPTGPKKTESTQDNQEDSPVDLDQMATAFESFPPLQEKWQSELNKTRSWSKQAIARLDLRLQTHYRNKKTGELEKVRNGYGRIAIPIRNSEGVLKNIRLYQPNSKTLKILSWGKGVGKNRLFPYPDKEADGPIIICEGEGDTICAISQGYDAVTQTSKRLKWPTEQLRPFQDRDVIIAYDADTAGQKYAAGAAKSLLQVANSIKVIRWPGYMMDENGQLPKKHGQDLTDFFARHNKTRRDFEELFSLAEVIEPADRVVSDTLYQFFGESITGRTVFQPRRLAERLLQDIPLLNDPMTGMLYHWGSKIWQPYEYDNVKHAAIKYLDDESTTNRVNDAASQARILSTIPYGRKLNDDPNMICLQNGMFDLKTMKVEPHRKDHYSSILIDLEFDPHKPADCNRWQLFLKETVQTDAAIMQLQEFFGYCLTRETRYEKCLIMLGDGGEGKSKAQMVLRAMCGQENCTSVSFDALEDQFQRSHLYGKLLNMSSEVGGKAMDSEFFKRIVSGDSITAAFKHKDSFDFVPYAKLVFSLNKMPKVLDNSDGLHRRLLPVRFKRQFLEDDPDRDPHLDDKLLAELSGVFAWSLVGLARLRKQGGFTNCEETKGLLADYQRLNNPVYCFVEDWCELGQFQKESKVNLYGQYKKYCRINGCGPKNSQNFLNDLRLVVKNLSNTRPTVEGKRVPCLNGISLNKGVTDS